MKKILSILLAVFIIHNLSAQQLSTTGVSYQFANSWPPGIKIFLSADEGFSGILYPQYGNRKEMGKDGSNAALIRINDGINSIQKVSFKVPLEYRYLTSFENDNQVIALYSSFDKKSDEFVIYKCILDKESHQLAFDPEKLASFELSVRDGKYYYAAHSEDNTKHSFTLLITNRKKEFKGIYTMLMNEEGEVQWGSTQMPKFDGQTFDIANVEVSNEGKVIMGVSSYTLNPRGTHSSDERMHVITISENEMDMETQPLSFGAVSNMTMKLTSNGNVFFAGYFSSGGTRKEQETGLFSLIYNPETKEFHEFNRHLGSLVENEKRYNPLGNRQRNSSFNLVCHSMHELDNGNVVLVGEQALVIRVTDNKGMVSYNYHRKDIFCHSFNHDGEEIETSVIPKYQIAASPQYISDTKRLGISFRTFSKDNDVYVVYNDNIDNYQGNSKDLKFYNHAKKKKSCTVLAKVTEGGQPAKKVINRYDTTSLLFYDFIYNTESEAILSFVKKKELTLNKLTF